MSRRAQLAFDAYTAVDPSTGKASAANAPAGFLGAGGGFAAAIALRAMTHTVPDQTRAPRALTLRLLAPMRTHLAVVVTPTIDRIGRSTTATSVQLDQGATTVARGHAIFAQPGGGVPGPRRETEMPNVPGPEECPPLGMDPTGGGGLGAHVERRPAGGGLPLSGSSHARLLVWMRLGEPRPLDALSVAFLADAAVPPLYATLTAPAAIPSLEISVHYTSRAHRPPAPAAAGALGAGRL